MNILLLHAYSAANKGDAAILSVQLQDVRAEFPDCDIRISTLDSATEGATFEGVPLHSGLFYHIAFAPKTIGEKFFNVLKAIIGIYPKEAKQFFDDLAWADKIIGVGGGYITARKGLKPTVALWLTLLEFNLAFKTQKPVELAAQSIGPFGDERQQAMAAKTLQKVSAIVVRERISEKLLQDMGISKDRVSLKPDLAFRFRSDKKQAMREHLIGLGVSMSQQVVAITVREWFGEEAQQQYEQIIADFADWLIKEKNMQVLFVPQVTSKLHHDDDREVQARIVKRMQASQSVWSLETEYDHFEIKGIYENMNYVVGTRMHSVIFALTANIPVIAIAYEHKTQGIMEEQGLGNRVVDITRLSLKKLQDLFERT